MLRDMVYPAHIQWNGFTSGHPSRQDAPGPVKHPTATTTKSAAAGH
jgi:hypothetical protein